MPYFLKLVALFLGACLLSSAASGILAQGSGASAPDGASEPAGAGETRAASAASAAGGDSTPRTPAVAPVLRAPGDSTKADSARGGEPQFTRKPLNTRRPTPIDSMHVNEHVVLALHAEPSAARRSHEEVSRLVKDCDALTTAVPPGDWDVFVIAAGFDLIDGVQLIFALPDDWTIRGFTLNPELRAMMIGDLRGKPRPCLVAFDCFAHPDRIGTLPKGVDMRPAENVVIGRLELAAPSAGSLVLVDHPQEAYGSPEVGNCWRDTNDVGPAARGRIDVGQGPGVRPCAAGELLSAFPAAPEPGKKGGKEKPPR